MDWSPQTYLRFGAERTRPARDLLAQIPPLRSHAASSASGSSPTILDLGCGPGNTTLLLAEHYPSARVVGIDSSDNMLAGARAAWADSVAKREAHGAPLAADQRDRVQFVRGDLSRLDDAPLAADLDATLACGGGGGGGGGEADLIFSSAAFHWLRAPRRIPAMRATIAARAAPGAVFAVQMPDSYWMPSHVAIRDTAQRADAPWARFFRAPAAAPLPGAGADANAHAGPGPGTDALEPPETYLDALAPCLAPLDLWHSTYHHVLPSHRAIVDWVASTGLRPFLDQMPQGNGYTGLRESFLQELEERLRRVYPRVREQPGVVFSFRRFFLVGRKRREGS